MLAMILSRYAIAVQIVAVLSLLQSALFVQVDSATASAATGISRQVSTIILISIRFMSGSGLPAELDTAQADWLVMTAGIATLPIDVFLCLAAALNIVVANTIKLAIEILVWLIPIPAVDAMLELGNKSLCASWLAQVLDF